MHTCRVFAKDVTFQSTGEVMFYPQLRTLSSIESILLFVTDEMVVGWFGGMGAKGSSLMRLQ